VCRRNVSLCTARLLVFCASRCVQGLSVQLFVVVVLQAFFLLGGVFGRFGSFVFLGYLRFLASCCEIIFALNFQVGGGGWLGLLGSMIHLLAVGPRFYAGA